MKPEERSSMTFDIPNAAGWPLHSEVRNGKHVYGQFGLPPTHLLMNFELNKNTMFYITMNGFQINMGGLPQLLGYLVKRFMSHDHGSEMFDEDSDRLETEILLVDKEPATPLNISLRYYGNNCNPLLGMAIPGYMSSMWHALQNFLIRQREAGLMTPKRASKLMLTYIRSGIESHRGNILGGAHQSVRISQALKVLTAFPMTEFAKVKCKPYYDKLRNKVPLSIRHCPNLSASFVFFSIWEDNNRDSAMNAGNLEIAIELMVSALGWTMGTENDTHKWYFQGVLIMGGAGSYRQTTKDGVVIDRRKPNGTGADFLIANINLMTIWLLQRYYGISEDDNKQTFVNVSRWTEVALENLGCYEMVDGNIVAMPDENVKGRLFAATEFRNLSFSAFIRFVFPRNDRQTNVSFVTVDPNKTNIRPTSVKFRKYNPNICCVATNQGVGDVTAAEEIKTVCAVTATMHPGAPGYQAPKEEKTAFNNVRSSKFQNEQRTNHIEPRKSILSLLTIQSHMLAGVLVALVNQSGLAPNEICESVLSFLDWIFLYINGHLSSVLEGDVRDSFTRIRGGYQARGVSYSLYKTVVALMAQDKPVDAVVFEANMRMLQCAMPLSEVCAM